MFLIPRARLEIEKQEFQKALECFILGRVKNGEGKARFEDQFEKYLGPGNYVAVHRGRCAIWLALKLLPYDEGEILIPAFTCSVVPDTVIAAGFTPVFVDVDPETFTIDPVLAEKAVTRKTRAIIPIHIFGHAAEMRSIMEIAENRNLFIIEDNASSLGASYHGRKLGTFGDMAIFSFGLSGKNITTGSGGMLRFSGEFCEKVQNHISDFKFPSTHEIIVTLCKLFGYRIFSHPLLFPWIHKFIPKQLELEREPAELFNVTMPNVNAEIGSIQLDKLDGRNQKRKVHAGYVHPYIDEVPFFTAPVEKNSCEHIYTRYLVFVDINKKDREQVLSQFLKFGVDVGTPFHEFLPTHPRYTKGKNSLSSSYHITKKLCNGLISIPVDSSLSKNELDVVLNAIQSFVK